ncbi:MAG: hypothetical protein R6W88_00205 [Desulfobacterales bacterium]
MPRTLPKSRSEMEHAESEYKKKLEMEKKLDRKEGIASAYGNLGTLY